MHGVAGGKSVVEAQLLKVLWCCTLRHSLTMFARLVGITQKWEIQLNADPDAFLFALISAKNDNASNSSLRLLKGSGSRDNDEEGGVHSPQPLLIAASSVDSVDKAAAWITAKEHATGDEESTKVSLLFHSDNQQRGNEALFYSRTLRSLHLGETLS